MDSLLEIHQSTITLHKLASAVARSKAVFEAGAEAGDILLDDGGEISVHSCGRTPGGHFNHREQLAGQRNLRKANLAGQFLNCKLMLCSVRG